jgi:hypothetical protein
MNTVRNIPSLEDEESLASYLYRVSAINNYHSISIIASEIKASISKINNNTFTSSQLTTISNLTGICTDKLQFHSAYHYERSIGKKLTNKLVIKNRIKYCPICIRERWIHKLLWNILQLNICIKHKLLLIERCIECNSLISLTSFMGGVCDKCGFIFLHVNLRDSVNQDSILKPQIFLYHQLSGQGETSSPLNLTIHDFLELANFSYYLLEGLPSYLGDSNKVSCFHNKKKGDRSSFNQSHAFNNVYWMYEEFPHNFYQVLDDFIKQKKPSIMYEQKGQFERISELDSLSEVFEAYQKYWLDKINLGLIRRDFSLFKKDPALLEQRKYLRKDEIRITVGTSYEKLNQLNNLKEINLVTSQKGNKTNYMVDKISYQNSVEENKKFITKKEAALMLGIQKDSVPKLIASGILKTYRKESSRFELISHSEVECLLDDCRGKLRKLDEMKGLKLHDALITYSVNGLSIVKIIQYAREGLLNPVNETSSGPLSDNIYRVDELVNCINLLKREQQKERGYYLQDVIALLKIGEKKAWRWIKEGKLVPDQVITLKDGSERYLFNKQSIDTMLRN